jgi:hypothetical protein
LTDIDGRLVAAGEKDRGETRKPVEKTFLRTGRENIDDIVAAEDDGVSL